MTNYLPILKRILLPIQVWRGVDMHAIFIPDIDNCCNVPCGPYGVCIDGIESYSCSCLPGITGDNCETSKSRIQLPSTFCSTRQCIVPTRYISQISSHICIDILSLHMVTSKCWMFTCRESSPFRKPL